jgi:hypothetical protein
MGVHPATGQRDFFNFAAVNAGQIDAMKARVALECPVRGGGSANRWLLRGWTTWPGVRFLSGRNAATPPPKPDPNTITSTSKLLISLPLVVWERVP